ncbi:MAG: fused MFS/spermidine synthase [Patescibacteria group bacterium]|nr:fused MFS/spermidine synthase [Patescibacteria group bacterium]
MYSFLKNKGLHFTVFITGACVLVLEILATRILAPYFGNTIFTVSSILSAILAALSIGYYVGGIFAERTPSFQKFFTIIAISGVTVEFFYLIGASLLPSFGNALPITSGPLIFSITLFFIPALLLGMLSPYAVKLQSISLPDRGAGDAAGKIFFWSTLGSIAGSLLAGFVLIPHFGTDSIMHATGIILILLGILGLALLQRVSADNHILGIVAILGVGSILTASLFATPTHTYALYRKDGVYEKITVYDGTFRERPVRFLVQDRTSSAAMFLDTQDPLDLVYDYTKYYALYKLLVPNASHTLTIGGGAYSIPKAFLAELPNATIDVAEIESALPDVAQRFFNLPDNPRLRLYEEDGRRFLADTSTPYDVIVSDVYYSLYSIPMHFTTQEFFSLAKQKLSRDGIFIANVIGDLVPEPPSLIASEIKTFRSVFPNSYFFGVNTPEGQQGQNIIFLGINGEKLLDVHAPSLTENSNPILRSLSEHLIDPEMFNLDAHPTLTDDYAPVEYFTASVLQRSISQ